MQPAQPALDINQLQAFISVSELASFSLAAEKLHLSQPAVSKRIGQLETSLDCRLFDRLGHRITLTEAGRALLPRARHIVLAVADSRRAMSRLGEQVGGTLALGTSHHIGLHRLPPLLKLYARRYPAVRLNFRFEDSEVACSLVEQGELELAVVTLPASAPSRLTLTPLWRDRLHFVVAAEHPLAQAGTVSLEQLAAQPALLMGRDTYTWQLIDAPFRARGLALHSTLTSNYLETLAMLTGIGLGWSVLPESLIGGLTVLKVAEIAPERQLGLVIHPDRSLSKAADTMIGLLREFADPDFK